MKKIRLLVIALAALFSFGAYADVCADADAPSDCQKVSYITTFNGVSNTNYNCTDSSRPYAWGAVDLSTDNNIVVSSATWADDGRHGIKVIMWYFGSKNDVEFGKAKVYVDIPCSGTQDKGSSVGYKIG